MQAEQSAIVKQINEEIRPILDKYDKVREILGQDQQIDLPQIVVIGDQSTGKSSLLESLCQVPLPKGKTCVTRCPLQMQLRECKPDEDDYALMWTEEQREENATRITDFSQIEDHINQKTVEISGAQSKKIVNKPIYLTICKKGLVNLTLIDLPGINYDDFQTTSLIKEMANYYIKNPNSIILFVITCSGDLNTGEALALAKEVDPEKQRTLVIATKIDRREQGFMTSFKDMNSKGLGVICVKNRSQEEVDEGISFEEVKQREMLEFSQPDLAAMPDASKGTNQLINQLVMIQKDKLLSSKHKIKDEILNRLHAQSKNLSDMPPACTNDIEKQSTFKEMVDHFAKEIDNLAHGKYYTVMDRKDLKLRARLDEILHEHLLEFRKRFRQFHSEKYYKRLLDVIQEDRGAHLPNFFSNQSVYRCIQEEVRNVEPHCLEVIEHVRIKCQKVVADIINKHFIRFPELNKSIQERCEVEFEKIQDLTNQELDKLLKIEMSHAYLRGSEPEYLKVIDLLKDPKEDVKKLLYLDDVEVYSKKEDIDMNRRVDQIRHAVHAYWFVFCKRFADHLHMQILFNFVINFSNYFHRDLDTEFSPNSGSIQGEDVKAWMEEPTHQKMKRNELSSSVRKLNKALVILEELNKKKK